MCGAAAEQSITKSRNSGGVRSGMVRAKKDHLKDVRTLASFVCVHVAGNKIPKSCFLFVYSFSSHLIMQNGVNDLSLSPVNEFKEEMKQRTNKCWKRNGQGVC